MAAYRHAAVVEKGRVGWCLNCVREHPPRERVRWCGGVRLFFQFDAKPIRVRVVSDPIITRNTYTVTSTCTDGSLRIVLRAPGRVCGRRRLGRAPRRRPPAEKTVLRASWVSAEAKQRKDRQGADYRGQAAQAGPGHVRWPARRHRDRSQLTRRNVRSSWFPTTHRRSQLTHITHHFAPTTRGVGGLLPPRHTNVAPPQN